MPSEIPKNENQEKPWDDCPLGELNRLNQKIKSQTINKVRNRRMLITSLILVALSPVVLVEYYVQSMNRNNIDLKDLGGVTCVEVKNNYTQYANHKLDEKEMSQIKTHLNHCSKCRNYYDSQSKKTARSFFMNHPLQHGRSPNKVVAIHYQDVE